MRGVKPDPNSPADGARDAGEYLSTTLARPQMSSVLLVRPGPAQS
jgi:hypothetical protein